MELLEREQFLSDLQTILADVNAGTGRFVLISGEAGIGKTALVEQFAQSNKNQVRVLWGTCDALFTPRPLGPLYDIAPQAKTDLLSLLEDQAPHASILAAVLEEMETGPTPSILVIEDVHWADEATLDLLKYLGRRINRIKSMLIATYRDDEMTAEHPLRFVLGDLPNRCVARLRLAPLSEASVNILSDRAGWRIKDLFAVTGGNPFFITEALASKESGVPVTVRDAVVSRAARLSAAARAVVELVSVVPARTEMWLLNDTVKPSDSTLEECATAGMLKVDGEVVAFRHELARRAIEESLAMPRRQHLHALVLTTLINRNAEALLSRIVHHAGQAHNGPAVLKFAPIAAREAAALSAHRESASHYKTALDYSAALPPQDRAALLESRSYECHLTGQSDAALELRREALDIWKQLGDKLKQGDNLRWMSRISWFLGRKKEAETYSVEAVDILEKLPPGPELAMAYSNRAQLHMLAEETEHSIKWGSRAIKLAEKLGATETLLHALVTVGTSEFLVQSEEGRVKLEESLRLALAEGYQEPASRAFNNLVACALRTRNYELAMRYAERGLEYTKKHDIDSFQMYMLAKRAQAFFDQGDWERAGDEASFVLAHYQLPPIAKITALAVLGHLRVRRGDPTVASVLGEARDLAIPTGELQRIVPVASARAEYAWLKGNLDQTIEEARLVLNMPRVRDDPWFYGEFAFWIWRASGVAETSERMAKPYLLHMSGDWCGAAKAWKEIGCPYEEAMALADGDEPAKRAALEIFERLGAGPAVEKVRQALRATGVRRIPRGPRPSTQSNRAGLTTRQVEVLSFMVAGLSNAEIATRLFISPRTVDHHVAAILEKLDTRTRAEAVSVALQTGVLPN
jgi:DNA-binding CsgD family transcriptional regulator/tetratricopeptide (TPR) repeat protein